MASDSCIGSFTIFGVLTLIGLLLMIVSMIFGIGAGMTGMGGM
ncbi:MAG: hypothetical protein ACOCPR_06330 [Guyparkeria sp.]